MALDIEDIEIGKCLRLYNKDNILINRQNQNSIKACISIRKLNRKDLLLYNKGLYLKEKSPQEKNVLLYDKDFYFKKNTFKIIMSRKRLTSLY